MTENTNKSNLIVRALKLAFRRWYVILILVLICASPMILKAYHFRKIKLAIMQLKKDNPQFSDWGKGFLTTGNSRENLDLDKIGGLSYLYTLGDLGDLELILKDIPVIDISALKGAVLKRLMLSNTKVTDISSLRGMPLNTLHLINCQVKDISALEGMQLTEINLKNTLVRDIGVLKGMPLEIIILQYTKVDDISPLLGMSIGNLALTDTKIKICSLKEISC